MLTNEQQKQFSSILEELGNALDITKEEYDAAVKSYNAVAQHLTRSGSLLKPYSPDILPQGSFMIGTIIRPVVEGDDIDIDLVCQLTGKQDRWTQEKVKKLIGDELRSNKVYNRLLDYPDGRRCWTLKYRENAKEGDNKYHMDILPAIVDNNYRILYEKTFSAKSLGAVNVDQLDELAIRITDKELDNYKKETNHHNWLKSNPFGYAKWFGSRAIVSSLGTVRETKLFSEWIEPVPTWKQDKLPLQRVVQIMKRHRDIFYSDREDKEDKPISIIITTLAARAYKGESNITETLQNIVNTMLDYISVEYDAYLGKDVKRVENPVNKLENFADKWTDFPQRENNFFEWHKQLQKDLDDFFNKRGLGSITESLSPFGERVVQKVFSSMGTKMKNMREMGNLKAAGISGTLGDKGDKVEDHNFHGKD